jgi:hypothetical protein
MANSRRTNPSAEQMTRLANHAARTSLDMWEAGAKSFIAQQVVIADFKQRMTTITASAVRQSLR